MPIARLRTGPKDRLTIKEPTELKTELQKRISMAACFFSFNGLTAESIMKPVMTEMTAMIYKAADLPTIKVGRIRVPMPNMGRAPKRLKIPPIRVRIGATLTIKSTQDEGRSGRDLYKSLTCFFILEKGDFDKKLNISIDNYY